MKNNKSKVGRPTDELKNEIIKCRVSSSYKQKLDDFIEDLNDEKINNKSDLIRISLDDYMKRNGRKGKIIHSLGIVTKIISIDYDNNTFDLQLYHNDNIITIDPKIELGECIKHYENESCISYKFKNKKEEIHEIYLDKKKGQYYLIRRD